MKVSVKLNHKNIAYIKNLANQALVETADAVKSDLQQSQTMPFGNDTTEYAKKIGYKAGTLQNRSTFVDDSKKKVAKYLSYQILLTLEECIFIQNIIFILGTILRLVENGLNLISRVTKKHLSERRLLSL